MAEVVIAEWTLTQQCGPSRRFCRRCTNSFTVVSCKPTPCKSQPPSTICVRPDAALYVETTSICLDGEGLEEKRVPRLLRVVLESGTPTNTGECCSGSNPTEFILQWNESVGYWEWYIGDDPDFDGRFDCCDDELWGSRTIDYVRFFCYEINGNWMLMFSGGVVSTLGAGCEGGPQSYMEFWSHTFATPIGYTPDLEHGEIIEFSPEEMKPPSGTCFGVATPTLYPIVPLPDEE